VGKSGGGARRYRDSQVFLGFSYELGDGVPQDYKKVRGGSVWRRAGAAREEVFLAMNYEQGQGVPQGLRSGAHVYKTLQAPPVTQKALGIEIELVAR